MQSPHGVDGLLALKSVADQGLQRLALCRAHQEIDLYQTSGQHCLLPGWAIRQRLAPSQISQVRTAIGRRQRLALRCHLLDRNCPGRHLVLRRQGEQRPEIFVDADKDGLTLRRELADGEVIGLGRDIPHQWVVQRGSRFGHHHADLENRQPLGVVAAQEGLPG